jgi:hypothetical protein
LGHQVSHLAMIEETRSVYVQDAQDPQRHGRHWLGAHSIPFWPTR